MRFEKLLCYGSESGNGLRRNTFTRAYRADVISRRYFYVDTGMFKTVNHA
jgi:hypothetical protein